MDTPLTIIEFNPQYASQVKELIYSELQQLCFIPDSLHKDKDLDDIPGRYKNRARFWIALAGDTIIGTIAIEEKDQKTAWLRRMFVKTDYHGREIGKKLLDKVIEFAKKQGYEKIDLRTDRVMKRAHRFYEKHGFVKTKEKNSKFYYTITL